jgi:arylsulfatase A-like enzyme
MALTTDLAPTILELAGAPAAPGIDGRSLRPLFTRTPADWRSACPIEYTTDSVCPRMLNRGNDAIRTARYKYIRYRELKDMNELCDLQEYPYELANLIASPTSAGVRQQMAEELVRMLSVNRSPER